MEDNYKKSCKLVLGNGFDLFCGLNTRYQDFFEAQKQEYAEISKWENIIRRGLHSLNNMEDDNIFIPKTNLNSNIGFWDLMFYYDPKNKKRINWCDVEKFILDFFSKEDISKQTAFDHLYTIVKNEQFNPDYQWIKYPSIYLINNEANTNTKIDFATYLLDELYKFENKFGEYNERSFTYNNRKKQ